MSFKFEKNVPIPDDYVAPNSKRKYPFAEMKNGDSVFMPGITIVDAKNNMKGYRNKLEESVREAKVFTIIEREEECTVEGVTETRKGVRIWLNGKTESDQKKSVGLLAPPAH